MDKVVHFEIAAEDMARAEKFYGEAFGWKMHPMPEMSYTIVNTVETDEKGMPQSAGAINGGIMLKNETAPYPIVVIKVASIEESLKKIEAVGGKMVMPTQPVGDMGLYARVRDTEGNIIGVWQDLK